MKKMTYILLFTLYTLFTSYTLYAQWYKQTVPINKPITGIKFIDTLKGWACTTGGTQYDTAYILHTTNGGANWYIQYISTHSDYEAMSVVDSNIIYVGGQDTANTAHLTKTTNGGLNWFIVPTPLNMSIGDMQFLNAYSGWESTSLFVDVRTTTDGG